MTIRIAVENSQMAIIEYGIVCKPESVARFRQITIQDILTEIAKRQEPGETTTWRIVRGV